jgi:predicted phage-related endonuclease
MGGPIPAGVLDRRTYMGGADVAAVFGVSKWKTAADVFFEKIANEPPPLLTKEKERFFRRRKQQEPFIANMLAEEYGMEVTRLSLDEDPNRYRDPEYPFLAAEIDFEFLMSESVRERFPERPEFGAIPDGTVLNGEIKTVHPFSAGEWGEQGSEEVPIYYAAQGMHGLGITRKPAMIVAALFGLDNLLCFPVMADQETIDAMRAECVRFWREHVETRTPPPMSDLADFKKLYGKFEGRPVEINDEVMHAVRVVEETRKTIKDANARQDEASLVIASYLAAQWGAPLLNEDGKIELASEDNAVLTYQGAPTHVYARQRGAFLDQKRLKEERPEITQGYQVTHHYRVLRAAKKGKK